MFNSSLIIPLVTIANMLILIPTIFLGHTALALEVILLNMVIGGSLFGLSMYLDGANLNILKFYPLAFVYLRICDFVFVKVMLEHVFRKKTHWGHLTRTCEKID